MGLKEEYQKTWKKFDRRLSKLAELNKKADSLEETYHRLYDEWESKLHDINLKAEVEVARQQRDRILVLQDRVYDELNRIERKIEGLAEEIYAI